ncbi:FAD:protein FMN transferase [Oceanihabitans sp. IOP_32]|uniref:FAD:protein FMN transferase n=1 Tax=Oceanihabitans sp. IOP_32 TaxID=2529032 RepID=UPI001292F345|nr:FAD:protein FMN transferase [Oceanihabitans sp. IOP_32]QFZ53516.1 FAD:protein FMN transferase [Oceanihabitans sp. IOP_32]
MRILAVLILSVISLFSCQNKTENTVIQGTVFGTYYRVIYNSEDDYQKPFDSLFFVINKSMSTYQENSDISKVNRNEIVTIDTHFTKVFQASKRIYKETHGAFDPTIGAVVNAWDFGPQGKIIDLDSVKIKNLMQSVGFDKVKLADHRIEKPQETFIDFNAIAKGYAVDVISEFLNHKNIENYLVDIGGELRVRGLNAEKNTEWRLGVENPNFDGTQSINKAFFLRDKAMATSGTYRKFKVDQNGNRYAHIIDTKTGYPSKTNLLSVSVIANTCMDADAYATAFKAMGIDNIKAFLQSHPELQVYLIFENEDKAIETLALNNFPE